MKRGFTLIELIVVMALILAIGTVVVVNLAGRRTDTDLVVTTDQIETLLRQAQSDSMSQEGNASWGVYFSNLTSTAPFYTLFSGSYATGTIAGQYLLPSSVAYQPATLPLGTTMSVMFSQVSGAASASTTIGLYMPKENAAFSSTISISPSGEVSF